MIINGVLAIGRSAKNRQFVPPITMTWCWRRPAPEKLKHQTLSAGRSSPAAGMGVDRRGSNGRDGRAEMFVRNPELTIIPSEKKEKQT